jgi:hypothetical protein
MTKEKPTKIMKVILRQPVQGTNTRPKLICNNEMVFFEAKEYEVDGQLLEDIQWLKAEVKRLRLEIQDLRIETKKPKLF